MRCRMYLPGSELQSYKGMAVCPYCIMDMRETDRKAESAAGTATQGGGVCERCGKQLGSSGYIFNGKKLCSSCIQAEKDKTDYYGGGPAKITPAIKVEEESKSKKKSILEYIVANVIGAFTVEKKKEKEHLKDMKPEIKYAKPMAEGEMLEKKADEAHVVEAIPLTEQKQQVKKVTTTATSTPSIVQAIPVSDQKQEEKTDTKKESTAVVPVIVQPEEKKSVTDTKSENSPVVQAIQQKEEKKPEPKSETITNAIPLEEKSMKKTTKKIVAKKSTPSKKENKDKKK